MQITTWIKAKVTYVDLLVQKIKIKNNLLNFALISTQNVLT